MRGLLQGAMTLLILLAAVAGVRAVVGDRSLETPLRHLPVVVAAPLRLEGAVVRPSPLLRARVAADSARRAERERRILARRNDRVRAIPGEAVEVSVTAYCLKGTTRRDNWVREGIVAADPRVFPLGKYVDLWIGSTFVGTYLVDDTGLLIKGRKLDVWTPTCRSARIFGRRKGKAVLVPRPADGQPAPRLAAAGLN